VEETTTADLKTGPCEPRSTVLSIEEDIVAFRRHTLLPLDDALRRRSRISLIIAPLPAASWHQGSRRQGAEEAFQILPDRLLPYRYRRGTDCRGQALPLRDRTSKFAFVQVVRKTGRTSASAFPRHGTVPDPHRSHGQRDPHLPASLRRRADSSLRHPHVRHAVPREWHRASPHQGEAFRADEPHHQGSDRQALPYDDHRQFEAHLTDFVAAYNFGRRLKRGLTPYEFICKSGPQSQNDSDSIQSIKCRD
jgi:hypothetical protein